MGQEISGGHRVLAEQLGGTLAVLPVHRADQEAHLYHQRRGGLPPPGAQGDQDQRGLYQRHGPLEAGIPGHQEH